MDALFIVGPNGRGNEDLRLALRSFAKFGRGVARVCASGYLPDWLSGEVAKFDLPDLPVRGKWKSIINRIVESVYHFDLRGDFICCSDDIMLARPVDFTDYPRYISHSAMPKEVPNGKSNRNYWRALVETRDFLKRHGFPCVNFMTHAHAVYNADDIRANRELILSAADETTSGAEGLCLLNNISLKRQPSMRIGWRKDIKMGDNWNELDAFDPRSMGQFSIGDAALDVPKFKEWANRELSHPCRFEIGGAE